MKKATLFLLLLLAGPAVYPQAGRPRDARARDQVTGQYVLRHSNVRGRLDARLLPGNQVKFSLVALLETAGGSSRNGVAQGTVPLQGDTAIYRDGECTISMRFLNAGGWWRRRVTWRTAASALTSPRGGRTSGGAATRGSTREWLFRDGLHCHTPRPIF